MCILEKAVSQFNDLELIIIDGHVLLKHQE